MHLENNKMARSQILIADEQTKKWIMENYHKDAENTSHGAKRNDNSIYLYRVHKCINNGLYIAALKSEDFLRAIDASKRLDEFSLLELADLGLFTRIAVLLSLRQDVLAAADVNRYMVGRIGLAQVISERTYDWPLLLTVVHPISVSTRNKKVLMNTPGFLKTAYPVVYKKDVDLAIQELKVKSPSYKKSYQNNTLPSLLYAIMRNESFFYPAAISKVNALGLFQFIPKTFDEIDAEWNLLKNSGIKSRQAFLLKKENAISLGVRWFAEKKMPAFDQNPLFATLSHHSGVDPQGADRVKKWIQIWKKLKWLGDIEIMIETFRKPEFDREEIDKFGVEARNFARWVITDMAITNAIGIYQ